LPDAALALSLAAAEQSRTVAFSRRRVKEDEQIAEQDKLIAAECYILQTDLFSLHNGSYLHKGHAIWIRYGLI